MCVCKPVKFEFTGNRNAIELAEGPSLAAGVPLSEKGLRGLLPCSCKGRRMSSQHTPINTTEDFTVQQEHELEALASIFGDDFQDLRNQDPWKVTLCMH